MINKHLASLTLDETKQIKMITYNQRRNWSIYKEGGGRITLYLIENVSLNRMNLKSLNFLTFLNKIILFSAVICNFFKPGGEDTSYCIILSISILLIVQNRGGLFNPSPLYLKSCKISQRYFCFFIILKNCFQTK